MAMPDFFALLKEKIIQLIYTNFLIVNRVRIFIKFSLSKVAPIPMVILRDDTKSRFHVTNGYFFVMNAFLKRCRVSGVKFQ